MRKIFKYIAGFAALLSLTSCEDVIQVKLDKGESIVTIDAFVNDLRQQQTVRLTYTDGYFSQKPNQPIAGATVRITDLNSGQVFNFMDNSNGDYTLPIGPGDTIGRIGHNYKLEVTHQGVLYTSVERLKRTASIDSIDVKKSDTTGFNTKKGYKCAFLGFDPPGDTVDYYWIKSFRNGVFFGKGGEMNICENAGGGPGTDGLPFIPPVAEGITPSDPFQKYDVCRVEIHSVTKETFDFLTQVQTQTTNSGLFATTPENVKTNITTQGNTKIVGWFSMSAVKFREKTVE